MMLLMSQEGRDFNHPLQGSGLRLPNSESGPVQDSSEPTIHASLGAPPALQSQNSQNWNSLLS